MKRTFKFIGILLSSLLLIVACSNESDSSTENETTSEKDKITLTISAAVSLKDAMDVIQQNYQDQYPEVTLDFNFGGSGSLQQQISQGAPVDLFFSAAEDKFELLVEAGNIAKEDRVDLLGNELVLIVPQENESIQDFEDLIKDSINHISIGTPETVPAGMYAKESLEKMNLWKELESKIVFAKDVRQVLSYVETGNVEAGIVYQTDAFVSDQVNIVKTADTNAHTPIIYPVGIIQDSKQYEAAKNFYQYLQSDEALKVFEDYGFTT